MNSFNHEQHEAEASKNPAQPIIILMIVGLLLAFISTYVTAKDVRSADPVAQAKHHQVVISGFEFVPKDLKVSVGDKITWVNKDVVPHNIIVSGTKKAVSPDLASGEKFTFVVTDSLSYECGFHPSMTGKLTASDMK